MSTAMAAETADKNKKWIAQRKKKRTE